MLCENEKVIRFNDLSGTDTVIRKCDIIKATIQKNESIRLYTNFTYPAFIIIPKSEYMTIAQALKDIFS